MRKLLAILASVVVTTTAALATNGFKGSLTWVTGTLNTAVTVTAAPQTVVLKVGSTTKTFTNTYIPQQPGSVLTAGTAFQVLAANSNPFAATFTTLNVTLKDFYDGAGVLGDRSVPITAAGALGGNIGTPVNMYNSALQFYYPPFTINNLSFPNGLIASFGANVASYNLAIPNSSTITTVANVNFPVTSIPENEFLFQGYGNGQLTFQGTSTSSTVAVAGNVVGTPTTFTIAELLIFTHTDGASSGLSQRN